jgi:hypothetical protein
VIQSHRGLPGLLWLAFTRPDAFRLAHGASRHSSSMCRSRKDEAALNAIYVVAPR